MTLQIDSKENYLNDFEIFSELHGNHFSELRKEAIATFGEDGFPEHKSEEWKYLNLSPVVNNHFKIANPSLKVTLTRNDIARYKVAGKEALVLVFVNGVFIERLSDLSFQNDKITACSLLQAEAIDHFGKSVTLINEPFNALNTAFFSDGAYVRIPANTNSAQPIHILHLNDSGIEATVSFPRNLIVAEKNSKAQIIVTYHSLNRDAVSFCNAVTEVFLDENAFVEFDVKQNEPKKTIHISHVYATQKQNSTFNIFTVTMDGGLVRNNLTIRLTGINCTTHLYGLTVAGGNQVVDHHTVVDHASPYCYSNQLYKGILDGHAQGVFNGKIFVRKDAQKTNAYQSNKNVLLSEHAVMNAKPQLEIFADDVKCSHGATTGQLDEDALFYFRARGIGKDDARALLNFAFASDVIEKINNESLKKNLMKLLSEKLHTQIEFDLI